MGYPRERKEAVLKRLLDDNKYADNMSHADNMSRKKGNCQDNATSDSFFHTLKTERVHHEDCQTGKEAWRSIFEYIVCFITGRENTPAATVWHLKCMSNQWRKSRKNVSGKVLPYHLSKAIVISIDKASSVRMYDKVQAH